MGFGKDGKGAILREQIGGSLGALASLAALKLAAGVVIGEDFRILKSEVYSHLNGIDAGEGDGLLLGIANGELSAVEIAEQITANGPSDRNDRALVEFAERQAHIVGQFQKLGGPAHLETELTFVPKEGGGSCAIDKFRWTYSDPEGWAFFVFNPGPAIATGWVVNVVATHYGVWVT